MDRDLMDKEVICILDTRQIQRFMFRSNSYLDSLGGSDLVNHILDDAIYYALSHIDTPLREDEFDLSVDPDADIPYFNNNKIRFQLIISSAGNALCIVRTGKLCSKIIRKISRYYLDYGYSLNITAAAVAKTDDFGMDIFHLYQKLNKIKASSEISDPLGALAIVARENYTGNPAIGVDERGEYYSKASFIRRKEAKKRDIIVDMKDMYTTTGSDNKEYLAVIHADGNNLGITIGTILQRTSDYEEGTRSRRRINQSIVSIYSYIMENTLRDLRNMYKKESDDLFEKSFNVVHQGGDDVNIICKADMAISFIKIFYKYLKGQYLVHTKDKKIPLYVCAGIAYVTKETTFKEAFKLAESCCDSAKKVAKKEENLRDGLAGNWIDYQICPTHLSQELDIIRSNNAITTEGIDLYLRPYCLDDEAKNEAYYFEKLLNRCKAINDFALSEQDTKMLKQSYSMGSQNYLRWIKGMENKGVNLTGELGKSIYSDADKVKHATWFDATEIIDFVNEDD